MKSMKSCEDRLTSEMFIIEHITETRSQQVLGGRTFPGRPEWKITIKCPPDLAHWWSEQLQFSNNFNMKPYKFTIMAREFGKKIYKIHNAFPISVQHSAGNGQITCPDFYIPVPEPEADGSIQVCDGHGPKPVPVFDHNKLDPMSVVEIACDNAEEVQ